VFYKNNNIELIISEAVELHAKELDPKEKKVVLANGEIVLYDKLILATGSSPAVFPIPRFDKKNVYTIKKDVKHLQTLLDTLKNVKDSVILGCRFIGVEFTDECKKNRNEEFAVKVTVMHEEAIKYLEQGFEWVGAKDSLIFLRKRK
jgi:NAD(P)H-nitrite reductase large subunit